MRTGSDRPGDFADGHHGTNRLQATQGAAKFIIHQGQLQAEGRRFAVNAVAAPHTRRKLMLLRTAGDHRQQGGDIGNEDIRRLLHLEGVAGIAHVTAGQAEMKPAAGVMVNGLSDGSRKANDIVIQDLFQLTLAGNETGQVGEPLLTTGLDSGEILGRNDFLLHQSLAGEQFNLQPDLEFVFVGPDRPHLGAGIARNHATLNREMGKLKRRKCRSPRVSALDAKANRPVKIIMPSPPLSRAQTEAIQRFNDNRQGLPIHFPHAGIRS